MAKHMRIYGSRGTCTLYLSACIPFYISMSIWRSLIVVQENFTSVSLKTALKMDVPFHQHCAIHYPVSLTCILFSKSVLILHIYIYKYQQNICFSYFDDILCRRTSVNLPTSQIHDSLSTRPDVFSRNRYYSCVIMGAVASQITSLTIVYLNRLFRRRSKKTSKLRVTGLCSGNSSVTGGFPSQRASNAENVSIWWRFHVVLFYGQLTDETSVCRRFGAILASNPTLNPWYDKSRGWGLPSHFPPLRYLPSFSSPTKHTLLWSIMFISDRCHSSSVAVVPVEYERDFNELKGRCMEFKMCPTEELMHGVTSVHTAVNHTLLSVVYIDIKKENLRLQSSLCWFQVRLYENLWPRAFCVNDKCKYCMLIL